MARWLLLLPMIVLAFAASTASAARPHDRDHDGLPDRWEKRYHLSTHKKSAKKDPDRDRLANRREYHLRTNPRKKDTDGDGYGDRREIRAGTNPRKRKSHPRKPSAPPGPAEGFPNASNTGVPAGTRLSAYSGPDAISRPGTVIDGKSMGCIRVTVPGVVIRNSKISCGSDYAVFSGDGDYSGTPLLVQNSEIDCKQSGGTALGEANITVRRVDIRGCENGGDINQSFTIEDSYIHDLYNEGDAHTDGLQFAFGHVEGGQIVDGSRNVTIKHNTIYGMGADGSFGTSAIISNRGGDRNVLIQGNLLAGGAVALYCEQNATGVNYRVLGNHFSRAFGPKVGYYGVSTDCSDETQSGNVIHETGQPVRLP
jgi:hypothetical protein